MSYDTRVIRPEYIETVFRSETPDGNWPPQFAVVTAWNPDGEPAGRATNAQLDEHLRRYCEEHTRTVWRVTGGSRDWQHYEESLGIFTDLEEALSIGRLFNQEAIFWVENDQLSVVSCTNGDRVPMGSWSDRVQDESASTPP